MSTNDSVWIRDPKGLAQKGKYETNNEDIEDFNQEKLIQEWLKREGRVGEVEFKYISRKGTARNTIDRKSVRLDAQVRDEPGSGTYADIIAGSDGRDLACRIDGPEPEPKAATERLDDEQKLFFDSLNLEEDTKAWAKKLLMSPLTLQSLRSLMKDDEPLEISTINLESLQPFRNFRK